MKYLLLLIVFCPVFCFGQAELNNWMKQEMQKSSFDAIQLQQSYANYCLNQFRKEKIIATWTQIGGGLLVFYANVDGINGVNDVEDTYNREMAIAGNNEFKQLAALQKYEQKMQDTEDRNDVLTISGGVMFLAGSILQFYSYRWLKKSYILPAEHGIGIQIKF